MAWWSYIHGAIEVSVPGRSQPEIQYILDTVLNHLPIVTGSERDMIIHAVRKEGHNSSCSCDEYGMRTNNLKDDWGTNTRRRGFLQTQDQYIIVIEASLRDRYFSQTKKEFIKWLCRLSKRLYVDDVLVRIWDYADSMIINEPRKFSDLYELPSWSSSKYSTGEPSWWEHLMWERDPHSMMPLMLAYKYYDNEKTDQEIERREKWHKEEDE